MIILMIVINTIIITNNINIIMMVVMRTIQRGVLQVQTCGFPSNINDPCYDYGVYAYTYVDNDSCYNDFFASDSGSCNFFDCYDCS